MRKIEDAAWNYSPGTLDRIVQQRLDFISGARYVLDQLTSEEMKDIALGDVDRGIWMPDIEKILAAVRKEIEG